MGLQSIHHGNQSVRELLASFLHKQRVPAVSLFYGPTGSGKSFFAGHFIQDILCTNPGDIYSCGQCPSCKTVKALTSPDLLKIFSTDGSSIKIEDIKKAQEFSTLQPVYSDRKMIWIEDAHLLTIEAFNSILKILEEPNQTTNFLLTTSKLDSIIPTVRSRSTAIPFSRYSDLEIQAILQGENCPDSSVELLSKIGHGNIKKALSFLDQACLDYRKMQIDSFLKLLQQASFMVPCQSKEEILNFISTSQTILADLVQLKLFASQTSIVNIDYDEILQKYSQKVELSQITQIWDLFISAEVDLNRVNVNIRAYFEFLCVSVKKIVLFC